MSVQYEDELEQALNEIVRHHKDFARISLLCELHRKNLLMPDTALQEIRNIVG